MQTEKNKLLLIFNDAELENKITGAPEIQHFTFKHINIENYNSADDINEYDLVISDQPEIKSLPGTVKNRIPFLFVLPGSENKNLVSPDDRIIEDYIIAPFTPADIILKINALIRRNDIYKNFSEQVSGKKLQTEANKILLIDDDLKLIRLFEYNLTRANFIVKVATSGFDAVEVIKSFTPDIIVCDVMMPEMNGYEFRKFLLEDPKLKEIPFVFLTAKGDEKDILEGYDLEIEDYIIKTAGPRVLIARLSAILKSLEKERKKLVSEIHQAADTLRAKVVPDNDPEFKDFSIKHWHLPYKGIPGGDFIDYYRIDENSLVVILGDVMGKKWGAWFFAFAYAGYIRSAIRVVLQSATGLSAASLLQKINESIYKDAKVSEVFATLSIVILNRTEQTAVYAGAGDFPIIFNQALSKKIRQISSEGLLLGFSEDGKYTDSVIQLEKGDNLILLTDGAVESRNVTGEQYGMERLTKLIRSVPADKDILDQIRKEVSDFTDDSFEDDVSFITIKYN